MPVRVFMGHGGPLPTKAWWTTLNASDPFDALEEWSACVNAARNDIDKYIQTWRGELDTLLVFGALYSGIVAAFLVDSYKWLQPDSSDDTVTLLLHLSAQLANETSIAASLPAYAPSPAQIAINVLWFSSLILSLTSILLTIMVKQWLSEYTSPAGTASPRHTLAINQARVDSLGDWHINVIVDWLPLLLISSLFLFFGGLATLLFAYSTIVGSVIIGLICIPAIIFIATSVLPAFYPSCSYRSVQAYLAVVFLGPVISLYTKRPIFWTIRDAWESASKRARLEPRALLWLLRTVCPWTPSLYTTVSICARSLDPTAAPKAACDLYRYSTANEKLRFTRVQARRWQMLIGGDEFEKTCSLLADGAKSLPAGPEWQDVDPDDVADYVKTLSLFLTLFSPEYLPKRGIEKYPATVFEKGLKMVIDIAIGDKFPKSLPVPLQEEVESFLLEQLLIINDFEWPDDSYIVPNFFSKDNGVKDPAADLLLPLTHAALSARRRHAASLFITLSTLALGMTRRMSAEGLHNLRDHLISLLNDMTAFILDRMDIAKETMSVKAAVSSWVSVLFEDYAHGEKGQGKAIQKWDLEDQFVQAAMCEFMHELERAYLFDSKVWEEGSMYRYRLQMDFGSSKDLCAAYVQSAKSDPWSSEHRDMWEKVLEQKEKHRATKALLNSFQGGHVLQAENTDEMRALCRFLPTCSVQFPLLFAGVSCLLDIYASIGHSDPNRDENHLNLITECVAEVFDKTFDRGTALTYSVMRDDEAFLNLSATLQRVLSAFDSDIPLPLTSPLPALILETLVSLDGDNLPGSSRIRVQLAQLLHSLERLVRASSGEEIGGLVIHWLMALGRVRTGMDSVFFAKESQGLEGLLRAIQENEDVLRVVRADSSGDVVFRNVCGLFEVALV